MKELCKEVFGEEKERIVKKIEELDRKINRKRKILDKLYTEKRFWLNKLAEAKLMEWAFVSDNTKLVIYEGE